MLNDGSSDGTRGALDAFGREHPEVQMVHLPENRGKGHAVRMGITRTTGTIVAIQDADLELDPAQLVELVAPVIAGEADVVYGSRFLTGSTPMSISRFGNFFLTSVTNLLYGASLTDMETCYKVMRGDVARGLRLTGNRFEIEPEITARLLRSGIRLIELPVRFSPRSKAAGKKMRWRDGVTAVRTLVRCRVGG